MFYTISGKAVNSVQFKTLVDLRKELEEAYALDQLQICEAASYSLAMVSRHALGSFAQDGQVLGIVNDSIQGCVTLLALRHLANAGASVNCLFLGKDQQTSELSQKLLNQFRKMELEVSFIDSISQSSFYTDQIYSCHCALFGVYLTELSDDPLILDLVAQLNDAPTPVHTLDAPANIDLNLGKKSAVSLYAASTLSLGVPLSVLTDVYDLVGRHYLCDSLIPKALYQKYDLDIWGLFSEQPVVQLFPSNPLSS